MRTVVTVIRNIVIISTLIIQLPIYQLRVQSLVLPRHQHQLRHHLHRQPYDLPNNEADDDLDHDDGGCGNNDDAVDDG
jgi:hypothetical protein